MTRLAGVAIAVVAAHSCCLPTAFSQEKSNENKAIDSISSGVQNQATEKPERLNKWEFEGSALGMSLSGINPGEFYVSSVRSGLAAELAGLKKGDRVVKIGGVDLEHSNKPELSKYLRKLPPKSKIDVVVERAKPELPNSSGPDQDGKQTDKTIGDDKAKKERPKPSSVETLTLTLITDPKAAFDGWTVGHRLKQNRVITEHLRANGKLMALDTLQQSILDDVRDAITPREAYEAINKHIDRLGVSHTAIIPKWGYDRLLNRAKGGIGLTLQRHSIDNSACYFVLDMEPGGPADKSELKIGDEILQVNDVQLEKSARLILAGEEDHHNAFMISSNEVEAINLRFRRTASGEEMEVTLKSDPNLTANSATLASIAILDHQGKKLGYVRFWNFMSMQVNRYLKDALENEFADCDALIVDLRGRGGLIAVLLSVERTLAESGKPVIGITDRMSRSAKEILAMRLKNSEHVKLVGEKTCGAVTAASFVRLPSGAALMFPVASGKSLSRYTNGIELEGRGVEPDKAITFSLPYLGGNDPLLETAKEQAVTFAKTFKQLEKKKSKDQQPKKVNNADR